jgi:hypothetical protein
MNLRHCANFLFIVALATGGCAALEQIANGRTDRLGKPPFVLHYERGPAPSSAVVLAPVALDRTTIRDVLVPSMAADFATLAAAMDARLAAMPCCRVSAMPLSDDGAPLVYAGSAEGETAPPQAEALVERWDKRPPMVLHLEEPSMEWLDRMVSQPPAPAYLWIRLALVDYPLTDEGLFGKKIVLGEGHDIPLPFLRAELHPLQVLQVTGALLAPDGRTLAAGAEGIHAMDTPFGAQAFGLQKEIDPETMRVILTELRREDLPDRPLKWEAALDTLVARLLQGR